MILSDCCKHRFIRMFVKSTIVAYLKAVNSHIILPSTCMLFHPCFQSQNKTIFDSGTCQSIMNDVLTNIEEVTSQEVTDINQRLSSMLCSLYHELVSKWFRYVHNTPCHM